MQAHALLYGVDSKKFNNFYANKGITPGEFKLEKVSVDNVQQELQALDAHKSTCLDN